MVRAGLLRRPTGACRALKLGTWAQIGAPSRDGHDLAPVVAVVELLSAPHEKIPSHGFDLLMRKPVESVELHIAAYDLHPVRDALAARGCPLELEVLFHPWLFPQLEYRQEDSVDAFVCLFEADGVGPASSDSAAFCKYVTNKSKVTVRDKVFMCMEGTCARIRLDPNRPVASFWSICVPAGNDVALVTKHVLLCETATGIMRQIRGSYESLAPGTPSAVLKHLELSLISTEEAARRLSRLMARCEAAFDGVGLELDGKRYDGPTEPHDCWDDQLRLLCRTVDETAHTAPLLNEMIRYKVLSYLGKDSEGDGDAHSRGLAAWKQIPCRTKAKAVHRVITELIHTLEEISSVQAELLAARPF